MWRLVLTVVVACAVCGFSQNAKNSGTKDDKIVGGTPSDIKERPYQVAVIVTASDGKSQCGGSILSSTKILTAAHCVAKDVQNIKVRAGSVTIHRGGVTSETDKYVIHPKYNKTNFDYDLAVVTLKDPLPLNGKTIKTVTLTPAGSVTPDGTNITISGWGRTSQESSGSNNLMEVTIQKISQDSCRKYFPRLTTRMICGALPNSTKNTCKGDSGGPVVLQNKTQVGVVSHGQNCDKKIPHVYASVSALRNWIKSESGV